MEEFQTLKAFRTNDKGQPQYLFHGIDKSKIVPLDTWVEADIKEVRDGAGTSYTSGFHSLADKETAQKYGTRFKSDYPVAEVLVRDTWPKAHSRHKVILSRWLYLSSKAWEEAREEYCVRNDLIFCEEHECYAGFETDHWCPGCRRDAGGRGL